MMKVGDKYIIEIGEICKTTEDNLYRVKGFKSLVFDESGLDKLERYNADTRYDEYYLSGLHNAWESLKWIARKREEAEKLFCMSTYDILMDVDPSEALDKITAYEKQKIKLLKEEFKVGDEVEYIVEPETKGVIIRFCSNEITFIDADGLKYTIDKDYVKKTGRHFPQIAEVLKQMQEGK